MEMRNYDTYMYKIEKKYGKNYSTSISKIVNEVFEDDFTGIQSYNVYGKVQSGKTSTFNALIGYAYDSKIFDLIIVFLCTKEKLYNQNEKRFKEDYGGYLESDMIENSESLNFRGKNVVIIPSLKNYKKIDKIIENLRYKNRSIKLLIIDDECDESTYSINSKTKDSLKRLISLSNIEKALIIAVTATPQIVTFEKDSPLSITKYFHLTPGKGYKGFEDFGKNKFIINDSKEELLKLGLSHFVNVAYNFYINNNSSGLTMLVNMDKFIYDNDIWFKYIEGDLESFRNTNSAISFKNACLKYGIKDHMKEWFKEVFIKECYTHLLTTSKLQSTNNIDYSEKYNIIVGGDIVGRGLTFPNLISTVFYRKGKSTVDVTLQRCRWFGYRESSIFNEMKIFTSKEQYEVFSIAGIMNEMLWDITKNKDINFILGQELPIMSPSKFIKPTSKNVSGKFIKIDKSKIGEVELRIFNKYCLNEELYIWKRK